MIVTCCRYHIDHEDTTDDAFSEAGRRLETNETGVANGSVNGNSINNDSDPYDFEDKGKKDVDEVSSGLAQAIVKSILSLGETFVRSFYLKRARLPLFRSVFRRVLYCAFALNFPSVIWWSISVRYSLTFASFEITGRVDLQKKLFASIQLVGFT